MEGFSESSIFMNAISEWGIMTIFATILMCFLHSWMVMSTVPHSVPWAGVRREMFSKTRACVREFTAGLQTLKAGYEQVPLQFNRKALPFVIPDAGFHPHVLIPQEHIGWMIDQPENVLSARMPQVGRFALRYLCPMLDYKHDMFMMEVVRKDLTRNLGRLQSAMVQDISHTIDNAMGLDDGSWNEICIAKVMEAVVFKSINRTIVGAPLCHDQEYLNYSASFATWLGAGSILVGQYMPWMMKPLFGYLGALPVHYCKQKSLKFLVPLVRDRMEHIKRKRADASFEFDEPKDLVTWMVVAALDNPETKDSPPGSIATRLLLFTLGAIHTTIMTATNIMLDLVSSNPDSRFWEMLREEAASVFQIEDNWADAASLPKLSLADSTIRESLRKSPVLTRVLLREVMPRDGVTLPSGHHLPKGAWVGAGAVGLQHDDRFYLNPDEYDPFRFARKQVDTVDNSNMEKLSEKASIYRKNQGLATTSDIYLAFGHGRHACPGRWLVAHLLKLVLAYITLNYDIQHMQPRPLNRIFGDSIIPSQTATMMVRRRKQM